MTTTVSRADDHRHLGDHCTIAREPDEARYREAIKTAGVKLMSAVTMLETEIVLFTRFGLPAIRIFEELVDRGGISVVPLGRTLAASAFEAYGVYGKGRGHPAQLNIIDCVAYALAQSRDLPLLFKGDDFARTDVRSALARG